MNSVVGLVPLSFSITHARHLLATSNSEHTCCEFNVTNSSATWWSQNCNISWKSWNQIRIKRIKQRSAVWDFLSRESQPIAAHSISLSYIGWNWSLLFTIVIILCTISYCFYAVFIMNYCSSVNDHLVPSAFNKFDLIWFELKSMGYMLTRIALFTFNISSTLSEDRE